MEPVIFSFAIDYKDNLLKLSTAAPRLIPRRAASGEPIYLLGTCGDHHMQRFAFDRDPAFAAADLALVFESDDERFPEVILGPDNEYLIPGALTQGKTLKLQVILRSGGEIKGTSNALHFALRDALVTGGTPLEPIPEPFYALWDAAFVAAELADGAYRYRNKAGAVVASVPAADGGSGGVETDPVYTADKPGLALKEELVPILAKDAAQDLAISGLSDRVDALFAELDGMAALQMDNLTLIGG